MHYLLKEGVIELNYGCMCSGKTTMMIHKIAPLKHVHGINVLSIKPLLETRDTDIHSRTGASIQDCIRVADPEEILIYAKKFDSKVVGIDEAHFLAPRLSHVVQKLSDNGLYVIISTLDRDYRGEKFPTFESLHEIAHHAQQFSAICSTEYCPTPATRTQKLVNGKPAPYDSPLYESGDKEIEGDKNKSYEPRCIKHFVPPIKPLENIVNTT